MKKSTIIKKLLKIILKLRKHTLVDLLEVAKLLSGDYHLMGSLGAITIERLASPIAEDESIVSKRLYLIEVQGRRDTTNEPMTEASFNRYMTQVDLTSYDPPKDRLYDMYTKGYHLELVRKEWDSNDYMYILERMCKLNSFYAGSFYMGAHREGSLNKILKL